MAEHGTYAGYTHGKCRCSECRKKWNDRQREVAEKRTSRRDGIWHVQALMLESEGREECLLVPINEKTPPVRTGNPRHRQM